MADKMADKRRVIEIWEPTYQMAPSKEEAFIPVAAEKIINDVCVATSTSLLEKAHAVAIAKSPCEYYLTLSFVHL